MCAAKLERTGFVLRNVWPNVKQQSINVAHEQSGGFIRKNSGKSESVPGASLRAAAAATQAPPGLGPPLAANIHAQSQQGGVFPPRNNAVRQHRARFGPGPRHVASDFLRAQAGFKQAKSFSSVAVPVHEQIFEQEPFVPALPREDRARSGISIDELIQIASEKYKLNSDFWGKYADIPSMAQATDKEDILQIIENFVLIHRKHVYLFQRLKSTVMKNLPLWSAPDLAALCHAWAQIGFLHEDLCIAMSERVTATAHACNAQELCWLMDAYATARCSVRSVTEEITARTLVTLEDFNLRQLCLHASSFARLNIHHDGLFQAMASHLVRLNEKSALVADDVKDQHFSARDLTLAAYSFAKLGCFFPEVFGTIAVNAQEVIRDFTARDLQMLIVAFARAQYHNPDLLVAVSMQAQRRIAQFSAEALTLMLRSLAFFDVRDSGLFTRALAQLPRMILTFRPTDVTTLLSAFAAVQVHSEALFDVVTPFILEKAPMFTPSDWLSALRSYSALGHRDTMFLCAMTLHLEASRLSLRQLSTAMVDCSRLSFVGHSESLAEAAAAKLEAEADGAAACPAEVVAQMYASLLLLGHSSSRPQRSKQLPGGALPGLLQELARRLSSDSSCESLSSATRVSLCYAMLLAPPARGGDRHPVATAGLIEKCLAEVGTLAAEERLLLRQILRVPELVPWNRQALKNADSSAALTSEDLEADACGLPVSFFCTAWNHLAPVVPATRALAPAVAADGESALTYEGRAPAVQGPRARGGVFVAQEIRRGLQDISAALTAAGIQNHLIADSEMEAHVLVSESAVRSHAAASQDTDERQIALLWGSSVHYASGLETTEAEDAQPRLSLSAKFQVALLQAVRGVEVVVVPHWWWQQRGGAESSGRHLASLLAKGEELATALPAPPIVVPAPSTATVTRPSATACIE